MSKSDNGSPRTDLHSLSSPNLSKSHSGARTSSGKRLSPRSDKNSVSEECLRKMAYPGEPIFSDGFSKESDPKLTHDMLKEVLGGAISKVKKGNLWRRLIACKDHRYIYYSKDLYSYSQIQPGDIICFMERAITKEFGVAFFSYVIVRERKAEEKDSDGPLEKRYLFWLIHFLDSKFQSLSHSQQLNLEVHKNNYLEGLFERYRGFDYESHVSTIWKAYGLDEDLFDFDEPLDSRIYRPDDISSLASDDTPRSESAYSSPRSENLSPRVIFLGKKRRSKKTQFGYLSLSPRTQIKDVEPKSASPREEPGTISLNIPQDIIDSLNKGSLSMSISFEKSQGPSENFVVSEKSSSSESLPIPESLPELPTPPNSETPPTDSPLGKVKRNRSYSTPCSSAEDRRKAWANNNNKRKDSLI